MVTQTGEIVKNKKEIDDDMPVGMTAPSSGEAGSSSQPTAGDGSSATGAAQPGEGDGSSAAGTSQPTVGDGSSAAGTAQPDAGTMSPADGTGIYHHPDEHHSEYHQGAYQQNANGNAQTASAAITADQAKEIALNHAGLTADAVYFKKAKLDYDDGMQVYDIEFVSGRMEYEYEINAATGAIWDYEWDYDD